MGLSSVGINAELLARSAAKTIPKGRIIGGGDLRWRSLACHQNPHDVAHNLALLAVAPAVWYRTTVSVSVSVW